MFLPEFKKLQHRLRRLGKIDHLVLEAQGRIIHNFRIRFVFHLPGWIIGYEDRVPVKLPAAGSRDGLANYGPKWGNSRIPHREGMGVSGIHAEQMAGNPGCELSRSLLISASE